MPTEGRTRGVANHPHLSPGTTNRIWCAEEICASTGGDGQRTQDWTQRAPWIHVRFSSLPSRVFPHLQRLARVAGKVWATRTACPPSSAIFPSLTPNAPAEHLAFLRHDPRHQLGEARRFPSAFISRYTSLFPPPRVRSGGPVPLFYLTTRIRPRPAEVRVAAERSVILCGKTTPVFPRDAHPDVDPSFNGNGGLRGTDSDGTITPFCSSHLNVSRCAH